jgi:hypothetical protein
MLYTSPWSRFELTTSVVVVNHGHDGPLFLKEINIHNNIMVKLYSFTLHVRVIFFFNITLLILPNNCLTTLYNFVIDLR